MSRKLNLRGVHVYEKTPGTQSFRMTSVHPAIRFAKEGAGVIWLQDGMFFDDGGQPVKTNPEWLTEEISKANPVALAEAGWKSQRAGA